MSDRPAIDAKKIWDDVQANAKKLAGCAGPHDFSIARSPEKKLTGRWACSRCGGEVDPIAKLWYERGLADARKAPT